MLASLKEHAISIYPSEMRQIQDFAQKNGINYHIFVFITNLVV